MAKLSPYIFSGDARRQADFYAKALHGEISSVQTYGDTPFGDESNKDRVMHLELKAVDQIFYLSDSDLSKQSSRMDLCLTFQTEEEARKVFEALADGGEVNHPLEKQFWGALHGRLVDPFGVAWQITTEA